MGDGLIRGNHRELDKAIHSQLVFGTDTALRIEPAFGILRWGRYDARNFCGYVADEIIGQPPYAGSAGEKPPPNQVRAATER